MLSIFNKPLLDLSLVLCNLLKESLFQLLLKMSFDGHLQRGKRYHGHKLGIVHSLLRYTTNIDWATLNFTVKLSVRVWETRFFQHLWLKYNLVMTFYKQDVSVTFRNYLTDMRRQDYGSICKSQPNIRNVFPQVCYSFLCIYCITSEPIKIA